MRWTVYRPVTVLVVFVAFLVVGVMAYPRIPMQLVPDGLTTGAVSIWLPVPDGTPEENLEQIIKPVEDLVRTIPGVREIFSSTGASRCFLRVEFDPEADDAAMVADIRERVDRAKLKWPDGVDRYFVWRGRMNSDMPIFIVSVGVEADESEVDVGDVFETIIQNKLLAVDGVARVELWGLVEKRATIDLDMDGIAAHAVPVQRLIQRLSGDNLDVTCGRIRDGDREYLVRSIGKFHSFDEIAAYPVQEGIRVGDVADVRYYRALMNRISRVDGLFSKVVAVHKDSMANTIDVCERVRRVFEEDIRLGLPRSYPGIERIELFPFLDQGQVIRLSVNSLRESGAWGGVLAMAVLFAFFRRFRITALIAAAIPFSLLITVVWIYFREGTFNILSLMGMSLGIGMLVDNSIVVVENIVRKQDGGLDPLPAAVSGVREVGLAVTLATLTTVVVFLPIMFIGDPRFKAIYQEVGAPLCVSVLASLLVALVFIPQGVLVFYRKRSRAPASGELTAAAASASLRPSPLNRLTGRFVGWCLSHRFDAFLLFLATLASTQLPLHFMKKSDTMEQASSRVEFRVTLPRNLSLEEANEIFQKLEGALDARREEYGIRSITSWFDSRDGNLNAFFEPGRRVKPDEFFDTVRDVFPRIPDVRVELEGDPFAPDRQGKRLQVFVQGSDLRVVTGLGEKVLELLRDRTRFPEIRDIMLNRGDEQDEVRVTVEREVAQHYGIDAGSVASMVSWALRGAMLPDYETETREVPFWIRFNDPDKESLYLDLSDLRGVPVYRPNGEAVRLENVATQTVHPGPGDIRRLNGKVTLAYVGDVETEDFFALQGRVKQRLEQIAVPDGYEITLTPRRQGFEVDAEATLFAAVLALVLVFFLMGFLFESVILPFSVLLSVPFAFFGAFWLLFAVRVPLDAGAMVGLIMLVGVVVNNAIVLVDTINRRRREGLERREAVLDAASVRFRPIWMTALTTIFGLLPLALFPQTGEGMDYKPMAIVLIGGLTTSTFFTLFVVPLFYTLIDDLRTIAFRVAGGR